MSRFDMSWLGEAQVILISVSVVLMKPIDVSNPGRPLDPTNQLFPDTAQYSINSFMPSFPPPMATTQMMAAAEAPLSTHRGTCSLSHQQINGTLAIQQ